MVAFADKSPVVLAGLKSLMLQDARPSLVVTACDGERFLDGAAARPFTHHLDIPD